jgi:hypothetical protein
VKNTKGTKDTKDTKAATRAKSAGDVGAARVSILGALCTLCVLFVSAIASAQIAMPDAKEMSGIPRPVSDLPNGAVSVRLIKGDLSNNITNHDVQLRVGDTVQTVKTDESGRAEFRNLPPGTTVKAVADVDGEHLESQEFPVQAQGGVRLMLVATDKEKEKQKQAEASAPAVEGQVVLTSESRIVMEPREEAVDVYYLLDIANNARAPVNPKIPFVFEMPKGATGTTILQGSSPNASVAGTTVTVAGPFPPGRTFVQVAASMSTSGGTLDLTQAFPAMLEQVSVLVKKTSADMKLTSPILQRQQDMPAEGETLIVGVGGAVQAGQPIALTVSGLPHRSQAPERITLGLALAIVLIGLWAVTRGEDPAERTAERRRLIARREKLFQDLVKLEHDHRRGRIDATRYAARREELVASLEHIYGALDTDDAASAGDRPGAVAPVGELRAS